MLRQIRASGHAAASTVARTIRALREILPGGVLVAGHRGARGSASGQMDHAVVGPSRNAQGKAYTKAGLARYGADLGILATAYFLAAKGGLLLAIPPGNATPVWPASGIALAAILVRGLNVWPGVFLGATLANGMTQASLATATSIGAGNTMEAVLTVAALRRLAGAQSPFDRGKTAVLFGTLIGSAGCMVAATVGVMSLWMSGLLPWELYTQNWWTWWLGDLAGMIVVTPLLLGWWEPSTVRWDAARVVEGLSLIMLVLAVSVAVFRNWLDVAPALLYVVLPLVGWTAFRFGRREVALAVAVVAGIAIWGTVRGRGPFQAVSPNAALLLLQAFVSVVGVAGMALAAFVQECRATEESLRRARDELEVRIREKTSTLTETNAALQAEVAGHKRTERTLRENEDRWRSVMEMAGDAIITVDEASRILYANPTAEEIFGYTQVEMVGQSLTMLMPGALATRHLAALRQFTATGKRTFPWNGVEFVGRRKGGDEVPVEISFGMFVREGKRNFVGIIRDVTARKRADEQFRQSQERFRLTFAHAAVGLAVTDPSGRFVLVNKAFCDITGYTEEELYARDYVWLTHPDDRQANGDLLRRALAERAPSIVHEKRYVRKTGEIVWVRNSISVIRDNTGRMVNAIALTEDITDRKRAQDAVREAHERLRTIIQASPLAIVAVDAAGRILSWDGGAERIFGWGEREAVGRVCPTVPTEQLEEYCHTIARAMRGEYVTGLVRCRQKKDGTSIEASLSAAPLRSAASTVTGAVMILEDVTERKRAERDLFQSRRQLRALAARLQSAREEERVWIAREIHDELGLALTGLKTDLSWLKARMPDAQRSLLEKIHVMLHDLDVAIDSVRKIATELRPAILDELGLWPAIEWQAKQFSTRMGIRCAVTSSAGDLALDDQRATAFFRIFQEALTNVARHAKATMVTIGFELAGDDLRLSIEDNGRGITDLETSDVRSLGLLGMRERAMALDGEVHIHGVPGLGTTVTARIPVGTRHTTGATA